MTSAYWNNVKSFLLGMDPRFGFLNRQQVRAALETVEHDEAIDSTTHVRARKICETLFNPAYLLWCKRNNQDPFQHARYPLGLRYFEYVPVNTLLAWTILMVPKLPFIQNVVGRSLFYNATNRLYCFAFDYQHRNPTSQELEDYAKLPVWQRLFKKYPSGQGEDRTSRLPLGIRYGASFTCSFAWNYIVMKIKERAERGLPKVEVPRGDASLMPSRLSRLLMAAVKQLVEGSIVLDSERKPIKDESGRDMASPRAGLKAVTQTWMQRCITVAGTLFFASFGRAAYLQHSSKPRSASFLGLLEVGMVALGLTLSVPFSMGFFRTYLSFTPTQLEPRFHHLPQKTVQVYRGD